MSTTSTYNSFSRRFGFSSVQKYNTTEFRQYSLSRNIFSSDTFSSRSKIKVGNPRLGRWKSLDPLMAQFPWQSPYCAFDNNPIFYKDPTGQAAEEGDDWVVVKNPETKVNDVIYNEKVKTDADAKTIYGDNTKRIDYGFKYEDVFGDKYVLHEGGKFKKNGVINEPKNIASSNNGNTTSTVLSKLDPPSISNTDESTQTPINEVSTYLTINFSLFSTEIQTSTDPFSNSTLIGIGMAVGEEVFYSEKFGTWLGRNGTFYSQGVNGNGTTGGKLGFAKQTSKIFKFGGFLTSAYGYYDNYTNYKARFITTSSYYIEQAANTIGCVPLYGTAWTIGWESGKRWGPSKWFGNNDNKWFE